MSVAIQLDNAPEFYTNLEQISGRVVLWLRKAEQIGSIVVKLEGESITALMNTGGLRPAGSYPSSYRDGPGNTISENHKTLYKVQQVFPDDYYSSSSNPHGSFPLPSGKHEYSFKFKVPINNACSDSNAMSKMGGLVGEGGFGSGPGILGIGGIRVMDGTRQLFYRHVTQTLPPSLTGFPMEAEIRYYLKVTVQRPGLLKENWRQSVGLKFLPIEPPRPSLTGNEAFARRPFTFTARNESSPMKRSSFFSSLSKKTTDKPEKSDAATEANGLLGAETPASAAAPSVELAARIPHPPILTCNQPVPLRLIAKKLVNHPDELYLIAIQVELVGFTILRANDLATKKVNKWVIISSTDLSIPLKVAETSVGKEVVIPDDIWKNRCLPPTVAPSFTTCNIKRRYELEIRLGISWGKPTSGSRVQAQALHNILHFAQVDVFSGINPPLELIEAARNTRPGRATIRTNSRVPSHVPSVSQAAAATATNTAATSSSSFQQASRPPQQPPRPPQDPLYPPQVVPGQDISNDAPPSYDEAVAEDLAGPFDGMQPRPAYSGVTNENAPSEMPRQKN